MKFNITSGGLAVGIWFQTALFFPTGLCIGLFMHEGGSEIGVGCMVLVAALIGSLPTVPFVWIAIHVISRSKTSLGVKFAVLAGCLFLLTVPYGLAGSSFKILRDTPFGNYQTSFLHQQL